MRPKFRAWHKTWEELGKVKRIRFDDEGNISTVFIQSETLGSNAYLKDIELMQSTGLFDLNGVEIFEGDIVRFFDSLYTVFYDIKEGSYRLKSHDDRWVVDYMSNFSSEESFEIIGNIYENKDILEAE